MDIVTKCYICKHPLQVSEVDGPLLEIQDYSKVDSSLYEDVMKSDRVLELASSQEGIENTLCENCLNQLLESLEKRLTESSNYKQLLENQLEVITAQVAQDNEEDVEDSEIEELENKLMQLKIEEKHQNSEFKSLRKELTEVIHKEHEFWQEANKLESKLMNFEENHAEILQRTNIAEEELSLLKKVNVLNDIFYISSENQFGTISGLRLGRLDTELVPWEEINAAWGQCALLLSTLSRLRNFKSAQCNLYPLGCFSRISPVHEDVNRFELFCSDTAFTKMIGRFNYAQQLFLETLYELSVYMEIEDPGCSIPYKIQDNCIDGIPVTLEVSNKENWTRALRFMLQNLKYLLWRCILEE